MLQHSSALHAAPRANHTCMCRVHSTALANIGTAAAAAASHTCMLTFTTFVAGLQTTRLWPGSALLLPLLAA